MRQRRLNKIRLGWVTSPLALFLFSVRVVPVPVCPDGMKERA